MTTYEPADWRPEPDDVAEVTWDGETARGTLTAAGAWWSRDGWIPNSAVEHVRRLQLVDPASMVVLNADDHDDLSSLAGALSRYAKGGGLVTYGVAEQILRSLLPAVTPPEPNGLGAVVEIRDDRGRDGTAVFTGCEWTARFPHFVDYQAAFYDLDVTKVVSHGVGCSCGAPDCNGGAQ